MSDHHELTQWQTESRQTAHHRTVQCSMMSMSLYTWPTFKVTYWQSSEYIPGHTPHVVSCKLLGKMPMELHSMVCDPDDGDCELQSWEETPWTVYLKYVWLHIYCSRAICVLTTDMMHINIPHKNYVWVSVYVRRSSVSWVPCTIEHDIFMASFPD